MDPGSWSIHTQIFIKSHMTDHAAARTDQVNGLNGPIAL